MKKGLLIGITTLAVTLEIGAAAGAIYWMSRQEVGLSIQEQLDLGRQYLLSMNYEEAIITFQKIIELDPKCAEAYVGLADAYIKNGEVDKANEVLISAPDDVDDVELIRERQERLEIEMTVAAVAESEPEEILDEDEPEDKSSEVATTAAREDIVVAATTAYSYPEITDEDRRYLKQQDFAFIRFEDLSEREQNFIDEYIEIAENGGDINQATDLVARYSDLAPFMYATERNGYKIRTYIDGIFSDPVELTLPNPVPAGYGATIEMRPQRGTSYTVSHSVNENGGFEFSDQIYRTCDTTDWALNGECVHVLKIAYSHHEVPCINETIWTGTMVDDCWAGVVTQDEYLREIATNNIIEEHHEERIRENEPRLPWDNLWKYDWELLTLIYNR